MFTKVEEIIRQHLIDEPTSSPTPILPITPNSEFFESQKTLSSPQMEVETESNFLILFDHFILIHSIYLFFLIILSVYLFMIDYLFVYLFFLSVYDRLSHLLIICLVAYYVTCIEM